jgi:hypothetical protein
VTATESDVVVDVAPKKHALWPDVASNADWPSATGAHRHAMIASHFMGR